MTKFFEFTQTVDPNIEVLDQELKASIAQIDGVQYDPSTKKLIVVSFNDNQTSGPIETIVNNHNPLSKTQFTADTETVQAKIQDLRNFIQNDTPTNAQSIATIKLLCRAIIFILKYLMRLN